MRANAQGLEFNTYESETIQKTSYSVFDENPLTFKGHFSISYDLAIQDYGSFGYIFRLKDLKRENADIYSFVFSYDNDERSYLKFNIEAKECLIVDTLCNKKLGPRRWIPIEISFFLKEDSVCLTIDKRQYQSGKLGLSGELTPTIMFGSSKFSEEIPSFAIRNLVISDMNQQINFPLNESSGILVHDKQGKIRGKAINPIWLINNPIIGICFIHRLLRVRRGIIMISILAILSILTAILYILWISAVIFGKGISINPCR